MVSSLRAAPEPLVFNRVRIFPAPDKEKALVGGRFTGSNISPHSGFEVLGEIKDVPPGKKWSEFTFANPKPYRWIRYEAPPGSYGALAEIEFYAGQRKLLGAWIASVGQKERGLSVPRALDGNTKTCFESDNPDGQYIGYDTWDFSAPRFPVISPGNHSRWEAPSPKCPAPEKGPLEITITCPTPGTTIRYTLDGTLPSAANGMLYEKPFKLDHTTTIVAVAFKAGLAPSPASVWTYLIEGSTKPGLSSFHIGNSLSQTTARMGLYARTAGRSHDYLLFAKPGAPTQRLWETDVTKVKTEWAAMFDSLTRVDHFTVQPRDFNVTNEAAYDLRFFNLVRSKFPQAQPWFYVEWSEKARYQPPGATPDLSKGLPRYKFGLAGDARPTDSGEFQSSQLKQLFPSLSWAESASGMLLYVEELQKEVLKTYKEGKRPRVLPVALAVGWLKDWLEHGKIPGLDGSEFDEMMFHDSVHPGLRGSYLIDMVWYAAFYGESPEGKVLPIGTDLTTAQSASLQKLAWDVVKNYPDCGLYEEGKTPCGKPQCSPAPSGIKGAIPVKLSSSTPGAWFRYTMDGTTPTRTKGLVYCGVVNVRPGMTLKAIAYKSGMADSEVMEAKH